MKVKELIAALQNQDPELEVYIVNGYTCQTYCGEFEIQEFTDLDGYVSVDIGIGGCEADDQDD